LFEESSALLAQLQNKTVLPYPLRRLGQVARLRGDPRRAVAYCLQSLAYNREVGEQQGIAASLVGLALVAQERGHVRTAAQLLGKTDALLAEIGSSLLPADDVELRLAVDRVRTRLAPAEWTAARVAGEQQSLDDLVRIAEALADTAPTQAPGLTPRQNEILRLVATGHTNREIAETLALSVATVERHLANIYARIGARGRADATLFAVRAGLLSGEPPVG
jgi:DNA-binding CsgD family transcriptional regulator